MGFLPPWACVLVGCFSVSLAGDSSLSDLYPPLWEESPGQFSDYRVENGKYIIDPWVYPERMGMYKILLNKTAIDFERFAPENKDNILWVLPLQHGWQYSTDRLAAPSKRTDCGYESGDRLCISVDSWWADINYFLSAIPFLAAVDSGIMGISSDQVVLLPPPKDQTEFCLNVSSCRSSFTGAMRTWNVFYQVPFLSFWTNYNCTCFHLFFRLEYYSKPEAEFGRSWAVAVYYIAASRFPTTLTKVYQFKEGLPPRLLVSGDKAPFIRDFTDLQNIVLFGVNLLYKINESTEMYIVTTHTLKESHDFLWASILYVLLLPLMACPFS
uniref:Chromosome 6 open reading frame 58 n=1 Tax=Equus asinus TaxID=9793 RepID=A0A8C4LMP3_EQUAS